jgi:hypothetical protein
VDRTLAMGGSDLEWVSPVINPSQGATLWCSRPSVKEDRTLGRGSGYADMARRGEAGRTRPWGESKGGWTSRCCFGPRSDSGIGGFRHSAKVSPVSVVGRGGVTEL